MINLRHVLPEKFNQFYDYLANDGYFAIDKVP
jgi:hypothetical protein